jgi:two-component system CheB/CheR fusion protein
MTIRTQAALVVGVGASAGGLEAFKQLLSALPDDSGMAFVLIQHLDPDRESLLSELLAPCTGMIVREADHGVDIEPDTVYVIRPDTAVAVRGNAIELSEPTSHGGVRLPVDHLFRSLARDHGARAVGIVLSGAGRDGSAGVRVIKAAGGLAIAQTVESSGQPGMPESAIATGAIDLVLPIDEIPAALARFARLPAGAPRAGNGQTGDRTGELASLSPADLSRVTAVLEAQLGFDARVYKPTTMERRVIRRMTLSGFEEPETYLRHLRDDPLEGHALVRAMLINVTDFFRDPAAFDALREEVIDPMVAAADSGEPLRVWVPGCATGEEPYSIGIEILDALDALGAERSVQIFATDIDEDALAVGRAGIYSPAIAERLSERQLRTYLKPVDGGGYQIQPRLRDLVSFAPHDLTRDPPFSRMNLVSCRNVLIYLTSETQRHVLEVLHFALLPDAHLILGTSESTGVRCELFTTVSKSHRIYRKLGASRPDAVIRPHERSLQKPERTAAATGWRPPASADDRARRAVLEAMVSPTIVVSGDETVLFAHGELSRYLAIPQGDNPKLELGAMLRPEIATRTRGALYKCRRDDEPVTSVSSFKGVNGQVRIIARSAPALGDDAAMITFEDVDPRAANEAPERPELFGQEAVIEALEKELQATREDLRRTVEELETRNEELRSSNEESMSTNEELQSTNEELEATTEELRSLNEELTAVNARLRDKVAQVEQAHDDLDNFFSSANVATIFLDEQLRIKRVTPAAEALLGIGPGDNGRRVADIGRELLQNDLEAEAGAVLERLPVSSRELETADGRWIARRILPYRTDGRRIEGVVVTFADITELRAANLALEVKNRRLELAWEAARGGIFEHRIPLDESTYVSDQWAQVMGYRHDELPAPGDLLDWLASQAHPDDRARFESAYGDLAEGRADRYAIELRFRHRAGHWIWVRKIGRALEWDDGGRPTHALRMMIDITDLKQTEESLVESEARFREMADGLPLMVWVHDASGAQELVNRSFSEFFGIAPEDTRGGRWQMLLHPDDAQGYSREFYACIAEERPFHAEARVKHADGSWRWIESWGRPRLTATGQYHGLVGTSVDVTERRQFEDVLRDSEERFRTLADNISQLAWMAHGDGSMFWFNRRWFEFTGTTPEQMEDGGWRSVYHPDHVDRVVAKLRRCFESGQEWEDTFPLRGAGGEYRWFLSRAIPIRDEAGEVVRWFGTNTDVTQLREVEARLTQADRQKDDFLAMLGHELRNPLAAIRSASELLKIGVDGDATVARTQEVLERQTGHMAKLLDGLLDISRIIRGKINLDREVVDLGAVCREVTADVVAATRDRDLDIRSDIPPRPLWVDADPVRLAQIVNNLLANSIKFTPDGGSVSLALRSDGGAAVLEVRDTGVGIDPELLPHVFEIFRQSDQSLDRSSGGLGLGLALVRTLTELHGGSVEARSRGDGQGAEFAVRLPIAAAPERPDSIRSVGARAALRILLIEDNEDAAEMLGQLLERFGHEVAIAGNGPDGVAAARAAPPDIVVCDLGLPGGMSGYDVAIELRSDAGLAGLSLVALSGYGRPEDRARSAEVGFDHHLTKPVDLAALRLLLSNVAPRES